MRCHCNAHQKPLACFVMQPSVFCILINNQIARATQSSSSALVCSAIFGVLSFQSDAEQPHCAGLLCNLRWSKFPKQRSAISLLWFVLQPSASRVLISCQSNAEQPLCSGLLCNFRRLKFSERRRANLLLCLALQSSVSQFIKATQSNPLIN